MEQNKTGKYFKYAIGEIVLVVIGILIALSINNWNENRKQNDREKEYLSSIHNDFVANKKQFLEIRDLYEASLALADSLIIAFPPTREYTWQEFNKTKSFTIWFAQTFDPINSSINGLINSGNVELVSNKTLRNAINSWMDQLEDYKQGEIGLKINANRKSELVYYDLDNYDNFKLSEQNKKKIYKLLHGATGSLKAILGKFKSNRQSQELFATIDTIIALTEPYSKQQ